MPITVFGAAGRTGLPLVRQALDRDHEVVAFVRSEGRLPEDLLEATTLTVVEGDAYTDEGVGEAVAPGGAPVDAVVSVLGQNDDGPADLLTVAGDHVLDATTDAGVRRFVTLVGAGVRAPGESASLSGRLVDALVGLFSSDALNDAETHVDRVRATALDWTVVRAPPMTTADGAGDYRAGDVDDEFASIPGADVARFVLDILESAGDVREMPTVGAVER